MFPRRLAIYVWGLFKCSHGPLFAAVAHSTLPQYITSSFLSCAVYFIKSNQIYLAAQNNPKNIRTTLQIKIWPLASRRDDISRNFFHNVTESASCLHHLLPDPNMDSHNSILKIIWKILKSLHTYKKLLFIYTEVYALRQTEYKITA